MSGILDGLCVNVFECGFVGCVVKEVGVSNVWCDVVAVLGDDVVSKVGVLLVV